MIAERAERVLPYALAAAGLAAAGVVAALWRPLAPSLDTVATELDRFGPEVIDAVLAYRGPRQAGTVGALALTAAVPLVVGATHAGRRLVGRLGGRVRSAPFAGALTAVGVAVATDVLVLPIAAWLGLVHDDRFGFRTAPATRWLRDWAIGHGAGWVLAAAGGAALVWGVRRWPASWHWRVVPVATVAAAVVVLLGPLVLEPLLLPTRPLEDGPVRDAVREVLAEAGAPEVPIVVGDASRRTTKVNAYVSGLGPSRRVVLYDTLLEFPPDRVALVVAHELAHREHRDIPRGVLLTATAVLPAAVALRLAASRWRARPVDPSGAARFVAAGAAVLAVGTVLSLPVASALSRRAEEAADHRALELSDAPATAVAVDRAFVVRDLADPDPPGWFQLLVGTHPTPSARIRHAVAVAEARGVELPPRAEFVADEADVRHPRAGAP